MSKKDKKEYDYEGDMAMSQLRSIVRNAQYMHDKLLTPTTNLPEWVQSKITLAEDYISTAVNYMNSELDESYIEESSEKGLAAKSKASGISLSTLRTVYRRGVAAWNSGHRPGTTPQQWGMARVNSYITKGKGTYHGADKDLREETFEQQYKRRVIKTTKLDHLKKKFKWRIKGKKNADISIKLYKEKPSQKEFNKQLTRVAGHEFGEHYSTDGENYKNEACWDAYKQVGMKKKKGKLVPNCVPKNATEEKMPPVKRDKASGLPKVYVAGLSSKIAKKRAEHFKQANKLSDRDPRAYEPAPGDATAKTKLSSHTIKYRKMYGHAVDEESKRIPRKPGQPANSDKHSDLYTDENPKGTIHNLKFATSSDAKESIKKIKDSGRSHAHKIQAAVAMEQRARVMGKIKSANIYRKFINMMKEKTKDMREETKPKKNVKLNKAFRLPTGSKKKFGAYVKSDKGNIVMVKFGDPNLEIKRDNPARRKNFRARHGCDKDPRAKDKTTPKYWSCRQWRAGAKVES